MRLLLYSLFTYQLKSLLSASSNFLKRLLDLHHLKQAQRGSYRFLAVMTLVAMLLWHQIIRQSHMRRKVDGAEALPSFVARIGSASDVKVFAATHVVAVFAR